MTHISAFIFRKDGKGLMKFKINIEVNLKELNKPFYSWDGRGKTGDGNTENCFQF